jgi:hypothetical protein
MTLVPVPLGRNARPDRAVFDEALTTLHYAGSCQRVGRCMRLLVFDGRVWVGGIVLGSTFPNVRCRDELVGLREHVLNFAERGLRSPWCSENTDYWRPLQEVVNHARTFVFPSAQGRGVAIEAHRLLLTQGVKIWAERYPGPVTALDTLCDSADSGLFRRNGWTHAGQTKGYGSDKNAAFVDGTDRSLRNNVALAPVSRPWEVWVRRVQHS